MMSFRFLRVLFRWLNKLIGAFGFQLVHAQEPRNQSDPILRLLDKGLSVEDYNSEQNMDLFYSDPNIASYVAERREFYKDVCGRLSRLGVQPDLVLDVGCGSGHLLAEVGKLWSRAKLKGVDFSEKSVELARRSHPNIAFEQCSIFDLSRLEAEFDVVICTEVLEHLEEADRALDQLHSRCRLGGWVVITVPNGRTDTFPGHVNFWTPESFCREFRHFHPNIEQFGGHLFIAIESCAEIRETRASVMLKKRGFGL
jgi:SAM-dependent methyltransferase